MCHHNNTVQDSPGSKGKLFDRKKKIQWLIFCNSTGSMLKVAPPASLTLTWELMDVLFLAGTGYSQERHEPPPARVHGDVFDEERPGRPDGDLQETHHTERRQVRTHVELFDVNLTRHERQTDANSRINLSHVSNRKSTSLITLTVDDSDSEEKERKKPALPADSESSDSCCDANAAIPPLTWRKP